MVPVGYGWLWGLQHVAGVDIWYNLVIPPSMFVWCLIFVIADIGARRKWSNHDRRKRGGASNGASSAETQEAAIIAASLPPAKPTSALADTVVGLVVVLTGFSVMALCKCTLLTNGGPPTLR